MRAGGGDRAAFPRGLENATTKGGDTSACHHHHSTIIMSAKANDARADGDLCPPCKNDQALSHMNQIKYEGGGRYTISKGGLEKQNNNIEQQYKKKVYIATAISCGKGVMIHW
mmetsp:Transcript_32077/g.67440  ORF Transcript_32077/g.67440 Transcript_32077/m.67440 type:complete len:113 (+) Transcript_32077:846-1184(+)